MASALEDKKQALEALYRGMPTAELQRRILGGELAAPAQVAAQAELQRRMSPEPVTTSTAVVPDGGSASRLLRAAAGVVGCTVVAWWLLPRSLGMLVLLGVVPWIFAPAAKAFPRVAFVCGVLLAALPVGLLVRWWATGALTMSGGDFKPLGGLIAWLVLIFVFVFCWWLASVLIFGARHRGSWDELHRKLEKMRKAHIDTLTK